ncbi:MAG: FtsQ-type POTRA domain-containing protein [Anaerolineae bacterium]
MRIQLTGDQKGKRVRKKARKGWGRRRPHTFEAAITLTQDQVGGASRKRRWPGKRSQAKRSRTGRERGARRRIEDPAQGPSSSPGRRAIRWRSVALRFPVVLALVALIGLAVYASTEARFFVYGAQIVGVQHLQAEEIYQAAGVHEQNIFWVDPQAVARRVVDLHGIKAVRVRSELPALVSIEVEEREPVVMWRATTQNEDLWLDGDGVVLPYHGDVQSPDMIFVVDHGERHLQLGDRIEPDGIVQSARQLAAKVPGVKVFTYQPGWGLSFTQGTDQAEWPVYVGTSEDLLHKIQVLQALTDYLQANNIHPRYVDVRWPDHPVYGRLDGKMVQGGE